MLGLTPYNKNQMQRRGDSNFVDFYNMLDDFFSDSFFSPRSLRNDTFKMDVKDLETSYVVEAELPGIKKEEVKLDYENDRLIISVESSQSVDEEKENYVHRERRRTSLQRALLLKNIDVSRIDAKLEDGVLNITIPKMEEQSNKIQIEVK